MRLIVKNSFLTAIALALFLGGMAVGRTSNRPVGIDSHLQYALRAVETAEAQLNRATARTGGWRELALENVKRARANIVRAEEFQRSHPVQ